MWQALEAPLVAGMTDSSSQALPRASEPSPGAKKVLREGERIGDYVVDRAIGTGGQGCVYLAHDAVLRRPVALKLIDGANLGAVEEARLIATLDHPNIVRVHHVQRHGDTWVMAMEYVDGADLKQRIQHVGPLSRSRALRFAVATTEALEHAHQLGVLHRDVKPQNLLVSRTGSLKLADFGLAGFVGEGEGVPGLGTPQFMAPEVWEGQPATVQTDIYCLGGTLLYLLTGSPPFPGKNTESLKEAHLKQTPKFSGKVPEDVAALISRCLAKKPSGRPASARALRAELLDLLGEGTTESTLIPADAPEVSSDADIPPQLVAAADAAVLAIAPYANARERLKKAVESLPPVLMVCGPQPEMVERVVRDVLESAGDRFYLGARLLLAGPASVLDVLSQQFKLGKMAPATAYGRLVSELQPRQGSNPSLMQIRLQRKLTDADVAELLELSREAAGKSLVFMVLGDQASGRTLFQAFEASGQAQLFRDVEISVLTAGEIEAYAQQWTSVATHDTLRWTPDALSVLVKYERERAAPLDRLIQNAVALARWLKMPMLTSWCVLGAMAHVRYIHAFEDILPKWRERPARWPDAPTLDLLRSLRKKDENSSA